MTCTCGHVDDEHSSTGECQGILIGSQWGEDEGLACPCAGFEPTDDAEEEQ